MGGYIPKETWVMQPPDVKGFGENKSDVADSKVCECVNVVYYLLTCM